MKRAHLITLASLAAALTLASPANAKPREWVFVYYMSYDNNLEGCGRPILNMLREGIGASREGAVVCFADFRDRGGMIRYELTHEGERQARLRGVESSGAESTLADCLEWVKERYAAKRYAVVFLNHGGRLGQMCLDEGARRGEEWLYVPEVAGVLERWRARLKGSVELVFLQQCGKGALENYHALRGSARYVMASQTVVGAPNHYYAAALQDVLADPKADGLTLARRIAARETDEMFTTYTTLSSEALAELPDRLNEVLEPLLARGLRRGDVVASLASCFDPSPEQFYDGLQFLDAAYRQAGIGRTPYERFARWVRGELVAQHRVSPLRRRLAQRWCGFSVFSPSSAAGLAPYRTDYPLYRESGLDELHDALLGRAPRPAGGSPRPAMARASSARPAASFSEAMLRQVRAAGFSSERELDGVRECLEDYEDARLQLHALLSDGRISRAEAAQRAKKNKQRLRSRLEARLPTGVFAALDPRQAMREVRR